MLQEFSGIAEFFPGENGSGYIVFTGSLQNIGIGDVAKDLFYADFGFLSKISDDILYLNIIGREPYSCSMGIGGLPPSDLEWQIVEMDQYYITMVDKWQ